MNLKLAILIAAVAWVLVVIRAARNEREVEK
jgi:hypothetical protein